MDSVLIGDGAWLVLQTVRVATALLAVWCVVGVWGEGS